MIRSSKRRKLKEIGLSVKTNPKKFWAFIKSKSKCRQEIPNLIVGKDATGKSITTTNNAEKANVMNNYFASVFVKEGANIPIPNLQIDIGDVEMCEDIVITEDEVYKKLCNLNVNKSPGPDGVHPKILKVLAPVISGFICTVFNESIQSGTLPESWKSAHISAIHKKGNKMSAENYRPISLTSVVCKILESIIRDKIMEYLVSNCLLSNKQFGFIPKRSAVLQLLKVFDDISDKIDKGLQVDVIYTDLSKAFDTVPHRCLLHKLSKYGISPVLLKWVEGFLCNRVQSVVIGGDKSGWSDVLSGVPQGSVLGPLLFIIYINDIVENLNSDVFLYADDAKIYTTVNHSFDLQKDLSGIAAWIEKWRLFLNILKCKVLHINKKDGASCCSYFIDGSDGRTILVDSVCEKDLGIYIDDKLSFDCHISEVVNKANKILGLIKRNFKYMGNTTFILLYKSLVRSHLEYGQSVWSPYLLKHIDLIEGVQRRATKLIHNLKNLPYSERLKRLNLPTLVYRRARGDMIETYKIMHGVYDEVCCPGLQRVLYSSTRGHNFKLYKKFSRRNIRKHFFTLRIVDTWNSLPEDVVNAPSVNSFKNRLDRFWKEQPMLRDYRAGIVI